MKLNFSLLLLALSLSVAHSADKPNIVIIYADDIGYGDLSCYGATKVKTPNCDKLAGQGIRFTDAHSPASVCTPSRFALLTGVYAFRQKGTGIASGVDGLLIGPERTTLPGLLKNVGYSTAVIGKWHLGLGTRPTNYNAEIKPSPLEIGFDYAWIMPATGDRVPCVWVENRNVVKLDPADPISLDYTVKRGDPASMLMGIPRIGGQTGGKSALWKDQELSTVIAAKSRAFIKKNREHPFFIFMASHSIHVPRAPNPQFVGKSDCGVRGDAIMEFDWMVGQVVQELDDLGLSDNTLLLVSSDNGGINDNNGPDKIHGLGDPDATNGHPQNGVLRGTKGTVFEGGTRVPLIVRWPAKVKPGVSSALINHVDFAQSFATLTGSAIPPQQARDSENVLPALLGQSDTGREFLLEQSNGGAPFGLRHGTWKYLSNSGALYDLATDLSETKDVAAAHPEILAAMKQKLHEITDGQAPGPARKGKKSAKPNATGDE